jgi:DNA-binding NtrC family response regulator
MAWGLRKEEEMRKRILVIDDDRSVRWLLRELLEDEAYEVDLASDGLDALEKLDQQRSVYDVILLDLAMPRMHGLKFLQEMQQRALDVLPSIIALSGDEVALQEAARMGVGNCLNKPFDLDVLLALVRRSLERGSTKPLTNLSLSRQRDTLNADDPNSLMRKNKRSPPEQLRLR